MNDAQRGWGFVGVQIVLLALVVFLPGGDDWSRPGWLNLIALGFNIIGFGLLAMGALGLGRSLTPTPVPVAAGQLQTSGLYGLMRHPIYTGVMAIVVGVSLGSGSLVRAAIGALTLIFFNQKAKWEEKKLTEAYPDYPAYAARVPRFVPRPGPAR